MSTNTLDRISSDIKRIYFIDILLNYNSFSQNSVGRGQRTRGNDVLRFPLDFTHRQCTFLFYGIRILVCLTPCMILHIWWFSKLWPSCQRPRSSYLCYGLVYTHTSWTLNYFLNQLPCGYCFYSVRPTSRATPGTNDHLSCRTRRGRKSAGSAAPRENKNRRYAL